MKRLILVFLAILMCFSIVACGKNEHADFGEKSEKGPEGQVAITEDMYEEVTDSINSYLNIMLLYNCNSAAKARVEAGSAGYEDGVEFTEYSVGRTEQVDDYTVKTFGKLCGETKYGDDFTTTFEVVAVCREDSESEKGYKVDCESFFD